MSKDGDAECKMTKTAFRGPVVDETTGARVYWTHGEDHENQSGVALPIGEGESMSDEAVFVDGGPGSWVPYQTVGDMKRSGGPVRANSRDYRDGWDRVFGGAMTVGSA